MIKEIFLDDQIIIVSTALLFLFGIMFLACLLVYYDFIEDENKFNNDDDTLL